MSETDLLLWARGPGFQWALGLFLLGMALRGFELFSLGRRRDLSVPRTHSPGAGWRTILTRSLPKWSTWRRAPATPLTAYGFHIGFFATLFLFAPHIELARNISGISWPALPSPLVDALSLLTILAVAALAAGRVLDPVKRLISGFDDYAVLFLSALPLLTGYFAFHHQLLPYTLMLALHILSAELLLALMPFTSLVHFATLLVARWYNGDIAGKKGVAS